MNIKLIALDMDGTLLTDEKKLPPDFVSWVECHPQIKVVIASGRQYYTLRDNLSEVGAELTYIAENGGLVFEQGEVIYSNAINEEDVRFCMDKISKLSGCTMIPCGIKGAYIDKDARGDVITEADEYYHHLQHCTDIMQEPLEDTLVKIAIYVDDHKAEEAMPHFSDLPAHLTAVLSGDSWIDISNASVNKGSAVEAIQKKYGINRSQCMAFGDYLNDVGLIASCEESYCMENGHEKLKAMAKHIAPSNNEYGVMQVLKQIVR